MQNSRLFSHLLANTLLAGVANNFLWFALVFWAYLETHSVFVTSLVGGLYLLAVLGLGVPFGGLVDHHPKKRVMLFSSVVSTVFYGIAGGIYLLAPDGSLQQIASPYLWGLVVSILFGVIVGNIRLIALSTMVTLLFDETQRDKANGQVGIANGIVFGVVSVFSGLTIGLLGMGWALLFSLILTLAALLHLAPLVFPQEPEHPADTPKRVDIAGTIRVVSSIGGLWGLIFFSMFNNFLGGVFMSLMDPYGLSLVSVEVWGAIWGLLSVGFIIGGMLVTKWGLGKNPIKTLLMVNVIMWIVCIFFTGISSIVLTTVGLLVFMSLHPYIEAAEQTIFQKVVPFERQGRVFGFAQSVEQAASPITAFLIGPIAQFWVIPFMASAAGVSLFGGWFGTTDDRAMALIFSIAGMIGLAVTLLAFVSRSYRKLSEEAMR